MSDSGDDPDGLGGEGLQVELFHAETDREPGDTNKQFSIGSTRVLDVHPQVFSISAVVIIAFIALSLAFPARATELYGNVREGIAAVFGWFFILVVNVFIIFMIYLALSKYGNIRLGGVDADKEFSDISWVAMLFSAGMGIGLMFFGVAEPVWHFFDPHLGAESATPEAAQVAMAVSLYHWGFHPWAIYALVGLSLAFFSFNRGLPLTFRSIFWPVLGERIYGWPGHIIDILTVFATLFGLTTSLGLGALQINAGLTYLGDNVGAIPAIPNGTLVQVGIIAGVTAVAVVSVAAGLDGGVRRLSNLNLFLMFSLLGAVLVLGPTIFIFRMLPQGIGAYFGNFFQLSFYSGAVGAGSIYAYDGFLGDWTIFYWAWWIAWSPFVGMFIARVSKGRTIREFITGVLLVPTVVGAVWLTVFGTGALHQDLHSDAEVYANRSVVHEMPVQVTDEETGETSVEQKELTVVGYLNNPVMNEEGTEPLSYDGRVATVLFFMLEAYPWMALTAGIATLCIIFFFVTSSDSASMVIDIISSGGNQDPPVGTRLFWAITEGVVAAILLVAGGLKALQTASITAALPFSIVIILMCFSLASGLRRERQGLIPDEQKRYARHGETFPGSTQTETGKRTPHEFDVEQV